MARDQKKLTKVINNLEIFINWFEDNHGQDGWLEDDGTWISYYELPEYKKAKNAIEKLKKELKING